MNAPATATEAVFDVWLDVPAITAIQVPMPAAETIMSLRLPNRSTVRTPIGEHRV